MNGGDKPLYMMGARLIGFTGIPPLFSGCGLDVSTASTYGDRIGLTFVSDRDMLSRPTTIARLS